MPLESASAVPSAQEHVLQYAFGTFTLDVPTCQLRRDGVVVPLTPKAFDVLLLLVAHRQRIVSKDEILKAVWPHAFVSEDNLTSNIWAIRKALGDDSNQTTFVATVPRRGYRFIASAREVVGSDEGGHSEPAIAPTEAVGALPIALVSGPASRRRLGIGLAAGVALLVGGAAGIALWLRVPAATPAREAIRLSIEAPEGATLAAGAVVSPDGRSLAFLAQDGEAAAPRLWVKPQGAAVARVLKGTDGATRPFWSPDGTSLGYFAGGQLRTVVVNDGISRVIAQGIGPSPVGGSWGSAGLIVYAVSNRANLFVAPASGGAVRPATVLDAKRGEIAHQWPSFLPDGRHFLFSASASDPAQSGLYVGSVDSDERTLLTAGPVAPTIFAAPGFLLSIRDQALRAQAFDVDTRRLLGSPVVIAGEANGPGIYQSGTLSASADGIITFGGGMIPDGLIWMDRQGRTVGDVKTALFNLAVAPDGRQVISSGPITGRGGTGVWLLDIERGVSTQIVADGNVPVWAPDGRRVAYTASRRIGDETIYVRSVTGEGIDATLYTQRNRMWLDDWSSDGQFLVYTAADLSTKQDLWLLPLSSGGVARPFVQTAANEHQAQVAPDSHAIAYASDQSGAWNVYVDSFPVSGAKRAISTEGGYQPQWSTDGRQLFYLTPNRVLMAVDVDPSGGWRIGRPRALFPVPVRLDALAEQRNFYAVSIDGSRFLVERARRVPAAILLNWQALLPRN